MYCYIVCAQLYKKNCLRYGVVGCLLDGSDAEKLETIITPLVSGSCSEKSHKVHVLLYSVCLYVIIYFNFWNEFLCSGVSS